MSLFKRHIGRSVAGVGVAVALLVLGLEAPAMAADITITALSPTSGPAGCVVALTGTGFDQPGAFAVATVDFTGASGADFHVVSDTELWTTVPALATTGVITVTNVNGDPYYSPVFTVPPSGAGGCAPTIASFTPTCGVVGTPVTITGTNLLMDSGADTGTPATDPEGGMVGFNPYTGTTADAHHTGVAESPTTLSVNVPAGSLTGPIRVTTFPASTVASTDSFTVVTDPTLCPGVTGNTHERSISLRLKGSLAAKGRVRVADDFTACADNVRVKIQKKKSGHWKTIKITTTDTVGKYAKQIKDKPGKYRSVAQGLTLETGDKCLKAKSHPVTNS